MVKCLDCGGKNKKKASFCYKCGSKLEKEEKEPVEHEKNPEKSHWIFFLITGIILLTLLVVFIPTKTVSYEIEVSYTGTETYIDKEPYETQENYEVKEPYESTDKYTDRVPVQEEEPYENLEEYYETVEKDGCNTDADCSCTKWGDFLWLTCKKCSCKKLRSVTRYRTITVYKDIEKERPVTKYRTVTKQRTVTKYRDVEKTREVLKTKQEQRDKEVNWVFGFKMPFKLHLPLISK